MKREPLFNSTLDIEASFGGCSGSRNMERSHFHNSYELFYMTSGSRQVVIAGTLYELYRGDLLIIEPYVMHKTLRGTYDNYSRYLLHFCSNRLDGMFSKENFGMFADKIKTKIVHFSDSEKAEQEFKKTVQRINTRNSYEISLATMQLTLLLDSLPQEGESVTEIILDGTEKPAQEIIDTLNYIDAHYAEDLNYERMCELFHMSKSTFYRLFKKSVGIPMNEYLTHIRAVKASTLLTGTKKLKISEVAQRCGFLSVASMTRVMKNIYHKTPRDIQKYGLYK
jgi:AraC-like DNA-binding protein